MKTSAVPADNQIIEAPAIVFNSQHDIVPAFEAGKLNKDCVVVVRFQGAAGQRDAGTAQTDAAAGRADG
ncbi:phosphogluconate dehydratase [Morganella morganii]|nr:phosphogluconate dehydratase [Morganella morganii]